jgi:hypothetical protein
LIDRVKGEGRLLDWALMLGLGTLVCLALLTLGGDLVAAVLAAVAEAIGGAR